MAMVQQAMRSRAVRNLLFIIVCMRHCERSTVVVPVVVKRGFRRLLIDAHGGARVAARVHAHLDAGVQFARAY